jgi:hypothetical protein
MDEKDIEKTKEILKNYKSKSNADLVLAMDVINKDFEFTKNTLIKLSEHLDKLESSYQLLLTEYQFRKNGITNR